MTAGDLQFIDSTHVAKAGSDVLRLYLEVLPRRAPAVIVHVHDIFWPFSYPETWHMEGRDWTEAYLLRALLTDSIGWEVVWFGSYVWKKRLDLAAQWWRPPSLRDQARSTCDELLATGDEDLLCVKEGRRR